MNSLLVKPENGDEFAIEDNKGLHFLDLTISSPDPQANFINRNGTDGSQQGGPILFGSRTATANFYLETNDTIDFKAKAHDIWQMVYGRELLRLRESDEPGICVYGVAKSFEFSHLSYLDKKFALQFELPSAYRYSVLRSKDYPLSVDQHADSLNIGMNLPMEQLNYTVSGNSFRIYNPSDFDIQPYEQNHDLNIIFRGRGQPTLTNEDTGDVFSYNKKITDTDSLVLNGVHPTLNGKPCEIDTNHGNIDLVRKSWNNFTLAGFSGTVTFDFPFLYL